jgi:hypothetical protein
MLAFDHEMTHRGDGPNSLAVIGQAIWRDLRRRTKREELLPQTGDQIGGPRRPRLLGKYMAWARRLEGSYAR